MSLPRNLIAAAVGVCAAVAGVGTAWAASSGPSTGTNTACATATATAGAHTVAVDGRRVDTIKGVSAVVRHCQTTTYTIPTVTTGGATKTVTSPAVTQTVTSPGTTQTVTTPGTTQTVTKTVTSPSVTQTQTVTAPAVTVTSPAVTVTKTVTTTTPTTTTSTTPTTPASDPVPTGMSGSWKLVFDDEFNGTSLDTSKWVDTDGWNINNVTTSASNVAVSGGDLILTLSSSTVGAAVTTQPTTTNYALPVGGFAEARIDFPGNGATIDNWPAWWASGPNWPAAGEHDIAEGLGTLTVNYHSPSGSHNQGTIPGTWSNGFHTYGIYRGSNYADVYYDGQLVKTYSTDDNGQPEELIINVGSGYTAAYGTASQVKVDYVRAWAPA